VGPFVRYTLLRLLVLAAVGALLLAVGMRGLLWGVVTVLVAAAVSYLVLPGPRAEVLARLESGRAAGRSRRGDASDEDVEDAAAEASAERPEPGQGERRG
jgi:hypothetical protein